MKIGFIYPPFDAHCGSFGLHGYELARELIARGHELHVVGTEPRPGLVAHAPDRLGKLRLLRHVDLLYIRVGFMSWLERCTWLRLLRPSVPVVWEMNAPSEEALQFGNGPDCLAAFRRDLARKRRLARLVDAAVCVSDVMADYTRDRFGIDRCVVAPNGADPAAFERLDPEPTVLARFDNRFVVFWAGDPSLPWQGLDQITEAADICRGSAPDVLFCMLLAGEPHTPLAHRDNMLLLKGTDSATARRYLRDADVSLAVYHTYAWSPVGFYGSSLKLFESMAAGKPTIATDIGQSRQVVRDGVNGLLVPADGRAVARAILQLRDDPALCRRLGEAARQRIASAYTWRHTVDHIEPLLCELVEARAGARAARHTVGVGA